MEAKTPLKIDVYSDVICPWCWLGKKRLETALKSFSGLKVETHFLPYELNPSTPGEGLDRIGHLTAKYGGGIPAMDARLTALGREEGLEYHFEKVTRVPNTFEAHRVLWLAGQEGLQPQVLEALHEAYFKRGEDLGDREVLITTAAGAGLPELKTSQLLAGNGGKEEVRAMEEKVIKMGITGVPFFIFNHEAAIVGAQPVDRFISAIKSLLDSEE